MMAAMRRVVSAVRSALRPPGEQRLVLPRPAGASGGVNIELSAARVRSLLSAAAYGQPAEQEEAFDEALERDTDLRNAQRTRRIAVTGLEWEIISATQAGRAVKGYESLADEAADYCREIIAAMRRDAAAESVGLDGLLRHLAEAVGRGTAVVELGWGEIGGLRGPYLVWPVPGAQLRVDPAEPSRLRIVTGEDWRGIDVAAQPAGKFVVHCPDRLANSWFRGGLLRPSVFLQMGKRLGYRGWQVGVEMFGLPITWATVPASEPPAVRDEVLRLLTQMGISRGGVFPAGCEIELREPGNPGAWPHERIIDFVNASYAKLWLGQTLTTQIGETGGAMAAAKIHDEIRQDIRDDDIRAEAATVSEHLLRPLVLHHFGARAAAVVPEFRRIVERPRDTEADARVLSVAVNDLGLSVPQRFASEQLGVPLVDGADGSAAIPGRAPSAAGFGGLALAQRCDPNDARRVAASLVERSATRRGALARLRPWLIAARRPATAHSEAVIAAALAAMPDDADGDAAAAALADVLERGGEGRERLAASVGELLIAAELAGRLAARERSAARRVGASRRGAMRLAAADAAAVTEFARLPFGEAIEALRTRLALTPAEFDALSRVARSRAFRVAATWDLRLLAELHAELVAALESGETARDFRRRALALEAGADEPAFGARRGWSGENPWHADLVHWQNTAMAYAAGGYAQMRDAGVEAWRFVSVGDSCPMCEPEIGRVYAIGDVDRMPPLHFGCDCDSEPVFEDELGGARLNESAREPNVALAVERARPGGFRYDVRAYGAREPIELGEIPPRLRERFSAWAAGAGLEVRE